MTQISRDTDNEPEQCAKCGGPMKVNAAYGLAFEVISDTYDPSFEEALSGLNRRLEQMRGNHAEARAAIFDEHPFDSFEFCPLCKWER